MKKTLYFKFILSYILLGIVGFILISTLGSNMIQSRMLKKTGQVLYKEAMSIASYQANADYDDEEEIEETYNYLKTLSLYQNARILILNPAGVPLIDTGLSYDSQQQEPLSGFDPASFGADYYQLGTYFNYYSAPMVNVLVPITKNLTTKGYVSVHLPFTTIVTQKEDCIASVYLIFLILYILSLFLLWLFSFSVYRPLTEITKGAGEYAIGNLKYKIPVNADDEIGYLATTLNYMSDEMDKMGEYQHQFVANVSHDFRSPLTSIKGYIQAILDGTIPVEMQDRYLKIVIGETERLEKLTQSLLTLDKLDSRGRPMHMSSFDINRTLRNTAELFEGMCRDKKITIELHLEPGKLLVTADMEQIQQVVYNLIDNAIKFSYRDSSIKIETTERHGTVFVSVKDSGIGIPKESLNKIWDRFYKTDSSRGKDRKGTGLGLSIVKEIITSHNQNINVISTEGVGTEFIFTLEKTK